MGIQERKEREKERRRQQIMVAAKRVFSDRGFTKATMEDIAQEAELSPGTLYLYFKNKEELYASLSLRILQYLLLRIEHVNAIKDGGPDEKLTALMEAMYDVYEFDPLIIINMFHLQSSETLKNLSPELLAEIKDLIAQIDGLHRPDFQRRCRPGHFHRPPPGRAGGHVLVRFFRRHSLADQQETDQRKQGFPQRNARGRLRGLPPGIEGQIGQHLRIQLKEPTPAQSTSVPRKEPGNLVHLKGPPAGGAAVSDRLHAGALLQHLADTRNLNSRPAQIPLETVSVF